MGDWISAKEARELSGYHIDTIRYHCRLQSFRAERRGSWWIDRQSFLEWLKEQQGAEDGRYGPRKRE